METSSQKSFYVMIESELLIDQRLTSTEKIIYGIISNYSNNDKGYCFLTYRQIAELLNIQKRTLYYAINNLITCDYITKLTTNQRTYLMPTSNLMLKMRKKDPERFRALFSYNWLEDDE